MDRNQGGKVPWDDLKYIFGEIMYGGHIVDDWDRKLCMSYLDYLLTEQLLDEAELLPYVDGKGISFKVPQVMPFEKYVEYIEQGLPAETPLAFGMNPNAETDFRTNQCNILMKTMQELMPVETSEDDEGGGGFSKFEKAQEYIDRLQNEAGIESNKPNVEDIGQKLGEDRKPFQNVFMQECEYMAILLEEISKSC